MKYDVAAYIWPSYTGDEPRSRIFWPEGMGEWETVKAAAPRFEGHPWPRKPLWGYVNEADPAVMEMEISQARRYGIDLFVYDWYWYDRRPFLENCLNDGFLKAANCREMRFYLMWANHDANYLWDRRLAGTACTSTTVWTGRVNRADFEEMALRLIDKYFTIENYYKIDGKPVFMIYDVPNFIAGLGGLNEAEEAVAWFRAAVEKRGFPGLFLQFCVRNPRREAYALGPGDRSPFFMEAVRRCAADGVTHYGTGAITRPTGDYGEMLPVIGAAYEEMERDYGVPYFPVVNCGWDNNPRHPHAFKPNIITGNTPEKLEEGLRQAKDFVDLRALPAPLVLINSWNEWTEGSYLEPDDRYGSGYLEAVRRVFVG